MTMWRPSLDDPEIPLYLAIANAIARDVVEGVLAEGERLPPQRDLADELHVALTTVTRAYTEAERRGLVSGEVGRGTFVRRRETFAVRPAPLEPSTVNLTVNSLRPCPHGADLARAMARAIAGSDPWRLFDYLPPHGYAEHRAAGAELLSRFGVATSPEGLVITSGAQHAMAVVFSTIANPGDTVLTGELTYSGMKSLANFLHIRLRGLAMDEEGIRPEALEAACSTTDAKALYCMPTFQNPTAAVMSAKRREAIVEIAERYRIAVVEDDSYGFLLPGQKPLVSLASASSPFYYLTGTSKSLAPGLRIGFLHAPLPMIDRIAASISSTTLVASPIAAEVVSGWIGDGTADRVMEWKRNEVRARQQIAAELLGPAGYRAHRSSPHGWLMVPEPWCVRDLVEQARMRGVLVSPAEDFIAARSTGAHAVRICLGPVDDRSRLKAALATLAGILSAPPEPCHALV